MNQQEFLKLLTELLALVPDDNVDLTSRVEMAIHEVSSWAGRLTSPDEVAAELSA